MSFRALFPIIWLATACSFMPAHAQRAKSSASATLPLNPYQAPWISAPQSDSTAMQWFLRTFRQKSKPRKAFVSVATTGKTQLLVNGMNVSRNLFEPYRAYGDTSVVNIAYDITPFIGKNNTLSLWYCPTMPHVGRRQVALCYWGEYADGTPFAFNSNEKWVCRRANRGLLPPQSEWHNATDKAIPWHINHTDTIAWQQVATFNHNLCPPTPQLLRTISAPRMAKVYPPSQKEVGGDTLTCTFPHHFQGFVRVTFRGTRSGENIYINNYRYISNGTTDEQAFLKFSVLNIHKVIIHGDKHFRVEHVQNVEAIEVNFGLYEKFPF